MVLVSHLKLLWPRRLSQETMNQLLETKITTSTTMNSSALKTQDRGIKITIVYLEYPSFTTN